jgi:4-hydroxy-tetrahydrodipicolinate reductase
LTAFFFDIFLHLLSELKVIKMNIALIGYGKMGKEIARIAQDRGHTVALIIDVDNASDLNKDKLNDIDVAIEFSSPQAAKQNIISCINTSTPVVSGTTGWLDSWDEVSQLCEEKDSGLFYASNFSVGVNILFAINSKLASVMDSFPQYEVSMEEVHHIHKLDEPSGTAISLADQITENIDRKSNWTLEKPKEREVSIDARREGEVTGFHSVTYESDFDSITISHDAKSRVGFATGAVLAAEFLAGKKGVFGMKDMLNL